MYFDISCLLTSIVLSRCSEVSQLRITFQIATQQATDPKRTVNPFNRHTYNGQTTINESISIAPICRKQIGRAWWWRLVSALFSVCDVEQFSLLACFVGMSWRAEPSESCDSAFHAEGALTLKVFGDNAIATCGTEMIKLSMWNMLQQKLTRMLESI